MSEWLAHLSSATAPAWWGAILSTLLALIKVWELWRDRFRVEINGSFSTSQDSGHEICIRNLSPKPIVMTHWEIFYGSGIRPFRKEHIFTSKEYDANDVTIVPYSTHRLYFRDENYFSIAAKVLKGRPVFIRIYIAGRQNTCRGIYH